MRAKFEGLWEREGGGKGRRTLGEGIGDVRSCEESCVAFLGTADTVVWDVSTPESVRREFRRHIVVVLLYCERQSEVWFGVEVDTI